MKILKITGITLLILIVGAGIFAYGNMRDRHPDYHLNLDIKSTGAQSLRVGFAAVPVTPTFIETWHDADNNGKYEPKKGDTYDDLNGNGKFDVYWMAGFGNKHAIQGVHDDIWARTVLIDDGHTRLALVSVDVIGIFHTMVLEIRDMLPAEAGITYLTVVSTHNHEAPDMMGLWGELPLKNGVNKEWKEYVKTRIVQSVTEAVKAMRPAHLHFSQNLTDGIVTLKDTREPIVFDPGLRMMQATDAENGEPLGTLIQWANHAETMWSRNRLITSDFPHYLREAVEKGVYDGERLVEAGVGGIAVYVNGAVGGLMTTHPSLGVKDPFRDTVYMEPSWDKLRAQGDTLGLIILRTMKNKPVEVREAGISLCAEIFTLPVNNTMLRLASAIGLIETGMTGRKKKRTEAAVWSIGPATFLQIPGELYPEILNGGIDALPGRDFEIEPIETPPLREKMKGEFRFAIGLANDEIGYIIPKSQWDTKAPLVYREKAYYGEENSMGPDTAPLIYQELSKLIEKLK
ncbi:MAG: neutral/alkaline non-lysosomal ceramidase N-terminal domain-containing protein [Bacteroidales bacterium]|jgi:hypothetical protein|nr:neutral/alkaline non-lysosomal ceramidase N-terminal domain-containing protein [Bacteroidales bacterium]